MPRHRDRRFIQVQHSAIGFFEATFAVGNGSREASFLMTEQLADGHIAVLELWTVDGQQGLFAGDQASSTPERRPLFRCRFRQ